MQRSGDGQLAPAAQKVPSERRHPAPRSATMGTSVGTRGTSATAASVDGGRVIVVPPQPEAATKSASRSAGTAKGSSGGGSVRGDITRPTARSTPGSSAAAREVDGDAVPCVGSEACPWHRRIIGHRLRRKRRVIGEVLSAPRRRPAASSTGPSVVRLLVLSLLSKVSRRSTCGTRIFRSQKTSETKPTLTKTSTSSAGPAAAERDAPPPRAAPADELDGDGVPSVNGSSSPARAACTSPAGSPRTARRRGR